jgi:hypothetical protein
VNCGETCDPASMPVPCDGSADGALLDGSTAGAFRLCLPDCSGFDDNQCSTSTSSSTTTTTSSTSSSTQTSTSTTTTTLDPCGSASHCGDGIVNCGELCDPADPADATPCDTTGGAFVGEGNSPGGAFIRCAATCTERDASACPAPTSTTTSTTTTSTSATTTTLVDGCAATTPHCGDGVVNCGEACDPSATMQPRCGDGSASGGFVTCRADCTVDRSACPIEICGNCADDDGDGDVDFLDADCCGSSDPAAMRIRKVRIRPAGARDSALRLRSDLGTRPQFTVDPTKDEIVLQFVPRSQATALCARIPSSQWKRKGKRGWQFRDPKGQVPEAMGLRRVGLRFTKAGRVRLVARGKRVRFPSPAAGGLQIVVGAHRPQLGNTATNQCSTATPTLRSPRRLAGVLAP